MAEVYQTTKWGIFTGLLMAGHDHRAFSVLAVAIILEIVWRKLA